MRRIAKAVVGKAAGPALEDWALRWRGTREAGRLPDRCINGYNLGPESSRRVGRRLARELLRQPARA